jgi:hypothetical protein
MKIAISLGRFQKLCEWLQADGACEGEVPGEAWSDGDLVLPEAGQ